MTERVYFCHSYEPEQRRFNEFFWERLRRKVYSWIDPGLEGGFTGARLPMDVSFNEWMMSRCTGFVAVIPGRESRYQRLEYRLATKRGMPKLVFIEQEAALTRFGEEQRVEYPTDWERFFEPGLKSRVEAAVNTFVESVDKYAAERRRARAFGRWSPPDGTNEMTVGLAAPTADAWRDIHSQLEATFSNRVRIKRIPPENFVLEHDLENELLEYDVLVVDVGPRGTPAELLGYLHSTSIPIIRVCECRDEQEQRDLSRFLWYQQPSRRLLDAQAPTGLPRMLDGYQLDPDMRPVGFWSTAAEMCASIVPTISRILRFRDGARERLETRTTAREYFDRRNPQPPQGNVFLSFASRGNANAVTTRIADILRFEGYSCFHYLDQTLTPGARLDTGEQIRDGLMLSVERSDVVVAFMNEEYLQSEYCMQELRRASELNGKDLELLAFSVGPVKLPRELKGYSITNYSEQLPRAWTDPEVIEHLLEEIKKAARKTHEPLAEQQALLREWLQALGQSPVESLRPLLTQQGVSPSEIEAWLSHFTSLDWIAQLLRMPPERSARQRHRELLTLLLLGIAETTPERSEQVERWLRRTRWLVWPPQSRPTVAEQVIDYSEKTLEASADPSVLGLNLYRARPDLLASSDPLCVNSDSASLYVPVEWVRDGVENEPLSVRRPIRWKLRGVPETRQTLLEARAKQGVPPAVLLIQTHSDLTGASAEIRQLQALLRDEYRRIGWPQERVEMVEADSAHHLLGLLSTNRHEVVHVAGHMSPEGVEVSRGECVTGDDISRTLRQSVVRLLVLNGCAGAMSRSPLAAGTFALLDQSVMQGRVPEVVAHRSAIADDDARQFALVFYPEFLKTLDVGWAVFTARRAGSRALQLSPVAVSQRV